MKRITAITTGPQSAGIARSACFGWLWKSFLCLKIKTQMESGFRWLPCVSNTQMESLALKSSSGNRELIKLFVEMIAGALRMCFFFFFSDRREDAKLGGGKSGIVHVESSPEISCLVGHLTVCIVAHLS